MGEEMMYGFPEHLCSTPWYIIDELEDYLSTLIYDKNYWKVKLKILRECYSDQVTYETPNRDLVDTEMTA